MTAAHITLTARRPVEWIAYAGTPQAEWSDANLIYNDIMAAFTMIVTEYGGRWTDDETFEAGSDMPLELSIPFCLKSALVRRNAFDITVFELLTYNFRGMRFRIHRDDDAVGLHEIVLKTDALRSIAPIAPE